MDTDYDIAFLGHYTKDTIVSAAGTRVVDGGAFNYGAHVAARMGLNVAAVTRLAQEDFSVVEELERLGVDVFARATPASTCLRIDYPTSNVDERVITVTSSAGPFTPEEVQDLRARAFVIGASLRGEVGLAVIEELAKKQALIAADVQGFVRVARNGRLVHEAWPEKRAVLAHVDVLKTDAVEAEMLTCAADVRVAARMLAGLGPREVVLTHRDGVLVYAGGQFHEAGFFPRALVGRSGRGDTCVAAYVARRLAVGKTRTRLRRAQPSRSGIQHPRIGSPAEATIWAAAVTSLKMEAEGPFRRNVREVERLIRDKYGG
jgi:sugar/nucleoside kinase (ribokinase family)